MCIKAAERTITVVGMCWLDFTGRQFPLRATIELDADRAALSRFTAEVGETGERAGAPLLLPAGSMILPSRDADGNILGVELLVGRRPKPICWTTAVTCVGDDAAGSAPVSSQSSERFGIRVYSNAEGDRMARTRTHADDMLDLAVEDLVNALAAAGVESVRAGKRSLAVTFDGTEFEIDVVPAAYATAPRVAALIDGAPEAGRPSLLVADRITGDARDRLNDGGWSWLDRRGHLRLRSPGVLIDTEVTPPARSTATHDEPIRGRAGLAIAYRLLAHPTAAISPTRSELGFAPSTVSEALERIRTAGLIDSDGLPVIPELFWVLAERWAPERTWLASEPDPTDPAASEWRVSGTTAAAALGAPVVSTTSVPDLYVPGPVAVTIAARRFGVARDATVAAASVAVAPVAEVTEVIDGDPPAREGWRLAHPVAVALDLAQDRSRGREILDDWSPPERVW